MILEAAKKKRPVFQESVDAQRENIVTKESKKRPYKKKGKRKIKIWGV